MGSSCRSLWSRRSCAAIGMFDVIMVSGIGEDAISAVSLVDFINQLINSVLTALSTGGVIVCSQYVGRKNLDAAKEAVQHLVLIVVLAWDSPYGSGLSRKPADTWGCSTALWKRA